MQNKMTEYLKKHLQEHFTIYILLFFCFLIGISIGAFTIKAIESHQKQEMVAYLRSFFHVFHTQELKGFEILKASLYNNSQLILLCWLMGVLVVGFPVVFLVSLFKGFVMGFTVGLLIEEFKLQGVLLFLFAVLPQNIFFIPLFFFLAACSISFSIGILRLKMKKQKSPSYFKLLGGYSYSFLFAALFVLLAGIIEAYVAPLFIRLIIKS